MQIVIVPPRAGWLAGFAGPRPAPFQAAPAGSSVHHIGSTAVPGLAAKDVIDVRVTVDDLDRVEDAMVEREGFQSTRIQKDHRPPNLDLPACEVGTRFHRGQGRAANVHVRQNGRVNQRFSPVRRDVLRGRPVAAAAYASIAQRPAERFPADPDAYSNIEEPVFDIIVEGANAWADVIGWSEPPVD